MLGFVPISLNDVPDRLNGYEVVECTVNPAGSRATVMVDRPGQPHRWVVASWYRGLNSTWAAGDYHAQRSAAMEAFHELAAVNAKRP